MRLRLSNWAVDTVRSPQTDWLWPGSYWVGEGVAGLVWVLASSGRGQVVLPESQVPVHRGAATCSNYFESFVVILAQR